MGDPATDYHFNGLLLAGYILYYSKAAAAVEVIGAVFFKVKRQFKFLCESANADQQQRREYKVFHLRMKMGKILAAGV